MEAPISHRIDYSKIPQDCLDLHTALRAAGFPISNLIPEIISDDNLSESFDYVISHLEHEDQREKYRPKKAKYIQLLKQEIGGGMFRITKADVRELIVDDGPKVRVVQAPKVYCRVGCHSIMVVVEKYTNPTLIDNTAASIKGRGMHWLFHRIEGDYEVHPEMMRHFYKNDVEHYYDNISQVRMKVEIRYYISDPVLLPILDSFITVLDEGLSKGLRSSQCFANLYLSPIDHVMCHYASQYTDGEGNIRYLYQRYMDDTCIWGASKRRLWQLRDLHQQEMQKLGLHIKPDEAVRPLTDGCNYLGFIFYGHHSRIRKRTKQNAARKLAKVKSRKRRQEIVGSFKGMACHADCKHLYFILTHQRMNDFGSVTVDHKSIDGKKLFRGKNISGRELDHKPFIVRDFERDVIPHREKEEYDRHVAEATAKGQSADSVKQPKPKYLVSVIYERQLRKLWTGDKEMWTDLDKAEEQGKIPFFSSMEVDYTGMFPKFRFVSAVAFGFTPPTDEEYKQILRELNLKE